MAKPAIGRRHDERRDGALRHALGKRGGDQAGASARRGRAGGRYLRLSRKDTWPGPASASGLHVMDEQLCTVRLRRQPAPTFCAKIVEPDRRRPLEKTRMLHGATLMPTSRVGSSPADGAGGTLTLAPRRRPRQRRLEARRGAEADQLLVVVGLFRGTALAMSSRKRPERRVPDDADARRGANGAGVGQADARIGTASVTGSRAAASPHWLLSALAPAPAPNSEPASAKTAPLMPRSSGMNGNGKRTSAVADQKVSPPSASSVSRSRGPKPPRLKPRMVSPPL